MLQNLFTPQKIHHHHHSTCYIVSFLHRCIYTLQHIPEDNNFYLVCRQNRSLTLPLHCNTCRMEHLDHENLSLCVLFKFSTCRERNCLLLLLVLLPVFQIAVTQPHLFILGIFASETLNDIIQAEFLS